MSMSKRTERILSIHVLKKNDKSWMDKSRLKYFLNIEKRHLTFDVTCKLWILWSMLPIIATFQIEESSWNVKVSYNFTSNNSPNIKDSDFFEVEYNFHQWEIWMNLLYICLFHKNFVMWYYYHLETYCI